MEWLVNLLFLLVGYYLSNRIKSDKTSSFNLSLNPLDAHKRKLEKKDEEDKQRETAIMLENINNYDGTSNKQKEVR